MSKKNEKPQKKPALSNIKYDVTTTKFASKNFPIECQKFTKKVPTKINKNVFNKNQFPIKRKSYPCANIVTNESMIITNDFHKKNHNK